MVDYGRKRSNAVECGRLRTIANDCERLSPEKQKVLLYLLDNGSITRKQAKNILNFQNTKTYKILTEMVKEDLLIMKGKGKNTHYILNPEITL